MGGRGSFSGTGTKRGLNFGSKGGSPSKELFPAAVNRTEYTGSVEKFTKGFAKAHDSKDHEFAAIVDKDGYAVRYLEGKKGSVSLNGHDITGQNVTHNHPKQGWANFSGADLKVFSKRGAQSFSAVSRNEKTNPKWSMSARARYGRRRAGIYSISRTQHFDSAGFEKAITKVKVADDNYDYDLHRWLKANQKTYGYKYSFTKASNRV